MRVIPLDGRAERLLVADLGNDGRDDVIVVNPRQARLDLYRWLDPAERVREDAKDPERPNELPLAPEWSHGELAIDELPVDAVAHDLDGDKRPELLVLTTPSNRIAIYTRAADKAIDVKNAWKKTGEWSLLAPPAAGKSGCLLVRDLPGGKHELLVSCEQGIQQLPLVRGSRAQWLAPRESRGRLDWHLADLDGDGDDDLVEWSSAARQVVRWYACAADGGLLPAQTIHDQPVDGFATAVPKSGKADLLLLGGSDKGMLRRYGLVTGEPTLIGRQDALPMAGAARRGWCGIALGEGGMVTPAIVAVDSTQPRLRVHRLADTGWQAEETFPSIGGIKAIVAPVAGPGTLLVWAKDAADLHRARWENGRFTYPQPWEQEGKDRKILALESVGSTVWWAQRVGSDVDLFVWPADAAEPKRSRYADLGAKIEQVVWLGGDTLLVQDAYATAGKVVRLQEGKPVATSPALLAKVDLTEYFPVDVGGTLRKASRPGLGAGAGWRLPPPPPGRHCRRDAGRGEREAAGVRGRAERPGAGHGARRPGADRAAGPRPALGAQAAREHRRSRRPAERRQRVDDPPDPRHRPRRRRQRGRHPVRRPQAPVDGDAPHARRPAAVGLLEGF